MRLKALLFPILLLVSFLSYAQTDQAQLPYSVSGTVVDAETGRPLQYVGVTFTGMKRAEIVNLTDDGRMMSAEVRPVDEIQGDSQEEMALVKKIVSEFENMSNVSQVFPPEMIQQMSRGISAISLSDTIRRNI